MLSNYKYPSVKIDGDKIYIDGVDRTGNLPPKLHRVSTHRVIAEIACGRKEDHNIVIFKDGDKTNIVPSNLEWVKRAPPKEIPKNKLKLSKDEVLGIVKMLNECHTHRFIAGEFKVSICTVSRINRGLIYREITAIDPNKAFTHGWEIRALPSGEYAYTVGKIVKFNSLSEAKAYQKQEWRKRYGHDKK